MFVRNRKRARAGGELTAAALLSFETSPASVPTAAAALAAASAESAAAAGGAAVSTAATGDAAGDAEVLMSCFFAAGASVVEGDERFVAEVIKLLDISISQLCKISRYSRRGYISKLEK